MPYMSSKNRGRYQMIEQVVCDFENLLNKNDTENGHIHKDQSAIYRRLLDSLVVPNVRSGILQLGATVLQHEEYIPIWVLDTHEPFRIADKHTIPTNSQLDRIAKSVQSARKKVLSDLKSHAALAESDLAAMPDVTALVCTSTFSLPQDYEGSDDAVLFGRPRVLLNADYKEHSRRIHTVAHELQHVHQSIIKPISHHPTVGHLEDSLLVDEIEAHAHQGIVLNEMHRQGLLDDVDDMFIDEISTIIEIVSDVHEASGKQGRNLDRIKRGLAAAGLHLNFDDYYNEEKRLDPLKA